jgi:hypothetical protein
MATKYFSKSSLGLSRLQCGTVHQHDVQHEIAGFENQHFPGKFKCRVPGPPGPPRPQK